MREHNHLATVHQGFPPVYMGDPWHFLLDSPVGMAHWVWSPRPQWRSDSRWLNLRPGSSSRGGVPCGALFMVRPWCINRPCTSWGRNGVLLNGLSPDKKRVTPVGKVGSPPNSSLRLNLTCFSGLSSARKGALLPHPTPGLPGPSLQLQVSHMETQLLTWKTRPWGTRGWQRGLPLFFW